MSMNSFIEQQSHLVQHIPRLADNVMCLGDMCPEPAQKFPGEPAVLGMIKTYEEYKDAINRYVY